MGRPAKPSLDLVGATYHYSFTVAGRRIRGSTGERDRAAAERALATRWAAAHAEAGRPAPASGPRLDLAQIAALWLDGLVERHPDRKPEFRERLECDLAYLLDAYQQPGDITPEAWARTLVALRGSLGSRSLLYLTRTARRVLQHAVALGYLPELPALPEPEGKAIRREAAPRRALTARERDRVLAQLRRQGSHRAARAWQTMVYTGLRWGELEELTLGWLDLEACVLRVPAGDAKSAEAEEIALHPKARSAIRAEAADRGVVDQAVPVFGAFDLRRAWRKALAASGIDPTGVTTHHSARHTFGSLVAESSGGDVSAVLAAGRWRSLSVAQRYVHASAERGRAAIRKL